MSVQIVLLCEDKTTNTFVRRFLRGRNFRSRDIYTEDLPDGPQSGEQWVRERYPVQLKAIRSRQDAFLIVVTDADHHTTQSRRSTLDDECRTQEVPPRTDKDPAIILVPRRNIETWFACLDGERVDETQDYSAWNSKDPRPFADELYRMCHGAQQLRAPAPASLEESCQEYRKLRR